jgi:hypothetical protein
MSKKQTPIVDIQVVTEIRPGSGETNLTFQNGWTVRLPSDHPDQNFILRHANRSLNWAVPVGVFADAAGQLYELTEAHDVTVWSMQEDEEDKNRLLLGFFGFSPIAYLTRDHPYFERIQGTLAEAARSRQRLWLANYFWPVESETEIWWKIMDVRPVQAPSTAPSVSEAAAVDANGAQEQSEPAAGSTAAARRD